MQDLLLQLRVERDDAQRALLILKRLGDLRPERAPGVLGQFVGILGRQRVIADLLQNAGQAADADALGEEVLQDALHLTDGELAGDEFGNHGRVRQLEIVEQHLDVLPGEDLGALPLHRLGQMRDEHRRGIDHGVTADFGVLALDIGDPRRGQLEHRLDCGHALELHLAVGRVHGEPVTRHEIALRNGLAFEEESILVAFELKIIAQPNGRNDHAHLLRETPPHSSDAFEQIAALGLIREADESVAQFDLQRIHVQQ